MADPITTDDLYGTSKDAKPEQPAAPEPVTEPAPPKPLNYEETPEIPMSPPKKKSGCLGTIMTVIIFLALFIGGIWAASFMRQFFPGSTPGQQEEETFVTPTGATRPGATATGSAVAAWKTYEVISGTTKTPFGGVTYQLPPDVLSPICDGSGCASQGTYLPGGTRFTVAPRGTGQALRDFRRVGKDAGKRDYAPRPFRPRPRPHLESFPYHRRPRRTPADGGDAAERRAR